MLLRKLPGNVTDELTAPGSELMKYIATDVIANQPISTREVGRKLNGGHSLTGPIQVSANQQLVEQIQSAVEAAVRKTLSQLKIPHLNIESPEEESKGSMEKEKQAQPIGLALPQEDIRRPPGTIGADQEPETPIPALSPKGSAFKRSQEAPLVVEKEKRARLVRPAPRQDGLLRVPSVAGTGRKLETRAQYPTSTSSAFSRSPEVQFGSMEQTQMAEPILGQSSPLEVDWATMSGEGPSDNVLLHATGGSSFPELGGLTNTWDKLDNSVTVFSDGMYASTGPELNLNVSGPASAQHQGIFPVLETPLENYSLEPWDFAEVAPIQSVDSGYESIIGPSDSNGLDDLDLDYLFSKEISKDEQER